MFFSKATIIATLFAALAVANPASMDKRACTPVGESCGASTICCDSTCQAAGIGQGSGICR